MHCKARHEKNRNLAFIFFSSFFTTMLTLKQVTLQQGCIPRKSEGSLAPLTAGEVYIKSVIDWLEELKTGQKISDWDCDCAWLWLIVTGPGHDSDWAWSWLRLGLTVILIGPDNDCDRGWLWLWLGLIMTLIGPVIGPDHDCDCAWSWLCLW